MPLRFKTLHAGFTLGAASTGRQFIGQIANQGRERNVANFFLIDQSLKDSSGHHFDYVQRVAEAANEMGFLTTIGVNRKLRKASNSEVESIGSLGSVRRTFRRTTYQPESYLSGLRHLTRSKIDCFPDFSNAGFWQRNRQRVSDFRHRRRREKLVRQFAVDCELFFRNTMFTPNDHAFFATVSELELMGLAVFLANQPRTMQAQWHLQFHFNLFDGRPPEYEEQTHIGKAVRSCFLAALSRLSYHSINFYTTSEQLADQYNRLGVGLFEPLPYPISAEFAPLHHHRVHKEAAHALTDGSSHGLRLLRAGPAGFRVQNSAVDPSTGDSRGCHSQDIDQALPIGAFPLKIACVGGIRREKGHLDYLQPLVDQIWEPLLAPGKAQLVLQRPKRKSLQKEKIEIAHPKQTDNERDVSPVVYLPHPLQRSRYVDLIKSTDIGLLFYDSRAYYSRRAGVLGELLASGKPVIVPAGSWLAAQVREPIFEHADNVLACNPQRTIELADFRWESRNVPMPGGVLSFDQTKNPFNFSVDVETNESIIGIRFDWHWPNESGVYCRIELTQFNEVGQTLARSRMVIGHRESGKPVAIFNVDPEAVSVSFSLKNAFHHSTAGVKNVEVVTVGQSSEQEISKKIPTGSVGVIAADRSHLSDCIKEVIEHLEHYQHSAERFAQQWFATHEAKRTLAHLIAAEHPARKSA